MSMLQNKWAKIEHNLHYKDIYFQKCIFSEKKGPWEILILAAWDSVPIYWKTRALTYTIFFSILGYIVIILLPKNGGLIHGYWYVTFF